MKVAIIFAVCLIQAISYQAFAGVAEKREALIKMATECMKATGAADSDLEELIKRDMPSTTPGKCMRKCLLEKFNIIKDGKLNVDACVEWTRGINKDDTAMINAAKEVSEGCVSISDPDGCEYVGKLLTCFREAAKARGIDEKKIW